MCCDYAGSPAAESCELFKILKSTPAWVLTVLGAGGSGKTTKSWWIMDYVFSDSMIFIFRYPHHLRNNFPFHLRDRICFFDEWREIAGKPGIVFLDDMAIHFLSRSSGSGPAKDFISMLTIGRHQGHRYIITCQNSILSDKGLFESLDQYSLRCRMTATQTLTEREEYQDLQKSVNRILESVPVPDDARRGLCYCPETDEILIFPNWPYMSNALSTPYAGAYVDGGTVKFV